MEPFNREGMDWQWMLSNACVKVGFPLELEYATQYKRKTFFRYYPRAPVLWIVNWSNLPAKVQPGIGEQ